MNHNDWPFLNYLWPLKIQGLVLNDLYENEFNLHVNENLQSYERMSTGARLKKRPMVIQKQPIKRI